MKAEAIEHPIHTSSRLCSSRTGGTARRWALVTCVDCLEAIADMERQQDLDDARGTEADQRLFQDGGLTL